jgi:hypothetical protein
MLFCFGRPGGDLDCRAQLPSSGKLLGHRCRRQRGGHDGAPLGSEGAVGIRSTRAWRLRGAFSSGRRQWSRLVGRAARAVVAADGQVVAGSSFLVSSGCSGKAFGMVAG